MKKLEKALAGAKPERLKRALVKTETITIRLSLADKTAMQKTAQECGLTLTDYLTYLHFFAVKMLSGGK